MAARVLHLFQKLGRDPGEAPASNVVFARSRREDHIAEDEFERLAQECWPLHQAVVDKLGVRVIVCLGRRAGDFVRERLGAHTLIDQFIEANRRRWRTCAHECASGGVVVTATHPSIADWTAPATDPGVLVQNALARTGTLDS